MEEQERERVKPRTDDPDVEAHRVKAGHDEEADEGKERREGDEESDVEAHRFKSS